MTIGTLLQLKKFFIEFEPAADKSLLHVMTEDWEKITKFISGSKQLHAGVENALEDAYRIISKLCSTDISVQAFRSGMAEWIDGYIGDKIVFAQEEMVRQGIKLLSKSKKDHIMVIGLNVVLEKLFVKAHADGIDFSVIVVDTSPRFLGRELV